MKQILSVILVLFILSLVIFCENNKNKEVKVHIEAQSDPKNRKISIHTNQTTAEIFWESDSRFKLINSENEKFTMLITGTRGNTAHFKPEKHKKIPNGNYIGIYPETADIIRYDSIVFSAHSSYFIDPSNLDKYISRHMLMYTENIYKRTSPDDLIEFKPAMTVLELPLCTDTGSFLLHTITVMANCLCDIASGAFIRKASLVSNGDSIKLCDREFTNAISYEFEGDEGLIVEKSPVTLKLLVWSSDTILKCCCDSIKYTIDINDGYFHKSVTRHDPFSNLTYYKLPVLHIPQPQIGYNYQGGVVCSTYIEKGITYGYVCAPVDLPAILAWSPSNKYFPITTYQGISNGMFNTKI